MKKINILILFILTALGANAQTEFAITPTDGFNNKIEVAVPGLSASELYSLAKSWVLNKKEITLAEENDGLSLTFEGREPGLVAIQGLGTKMPQETRYSVKMIFGPEKYTFYVWSVEYYHIASARWLDAALSKSKDFFNKKGELKGMYKHYGDIPAFFNKLNLDYTAYINNNRK